MDILYYIGDGSHHNNRELMYSLRALEKHCKDVGNVWIVGNKPHFLNNNIKYLWVEDKQGEFWKNAFRKTKAAIEAGISDEFLLMNDDFYMLKDFEASKYPYYYQGEIKDDASTAYKKVIYNTKKILEENGFSTRHYGVHCPMRIEGKKYLEIERYLDKPASPRCLYGNMFCKGQRVADCKGDEMISNRTGCYSTRDWIGKDVFNQLRELFPEPSKWEKEEA